MKRAVLWLLTVSLSCFAAVLRAADDPLPSWNDGPSKAAITSFVARVTREALPDFVKPQERIAVFDNDGTLWCEQPVVLSTAVRIRPDQALAKDHPEWKEQEPFKSVLDRRHEKRWRRPASRNCSPLWRPLTLA